MTRPILAKVNRHVNYYVTTTRKIRPATITAVAGGGSTTLAAQANANDTTLSTAATAAVNQFVTIVDGTNTEQRRVTAVGGAGPFSLTVAAIRFTHANGTTVRLEPTSVTLRVGHTTPIAGVTRQINKTDTNVWKGLA